MSNDSAILREIAEIPTVLRQSSAVQFEAIGKAVHALGGEKPRLLATMGRGSSDHAATFLRYAFGISLGIPGSSISPSMSSIYGRQLDLKGALCLVVSQSGRSPDIVRAAGMARRGGALVATIVNDMSSPLAKEVDVVIPINAGEERAIAATKSFMGAAAAGLRLLTILSSDASLRRALDTLPDVLEQTDRNHTIDLFAIVKARTAFVIGRGPALGIAQEAALKLKEIVQFPAEAYSSAEVRHGPWQLGQTDCALVGWKTDAVSSESQNAVVSAYRALGRPVLDLQDIGRRSAENLGNMIAPLIPLPGFYRALVMAAMQLGLDPDRPKLLSKVTETI
ncbi:MAG: SIS domain-containing protein [Mesorhizobium sp.]|uniref:SIS domain-containing protein n=1 Tax=Mesorhizobium sp. TaxID=1871066 RepID=UPI000FEA9335|nr:SIS domain-containing protein [Mesorhizobium sp.]RWB31412.1 MAG: SIS domain-containing protein [Mesorhizobium sp.]RWB79483.1 MAG: SIS domain-containing protein [Mesorhizobium sp.]RWF68907.1 MAG: SIS domain-containing protein [Mesorhizobium sp.]TIS66373.1 MAG: SIS domain-containing protein [Mesorhizobium sp.]